MALVFRLRCLRDFFFASLLLIVHYYLQSLIVEEMNVDVFVYNDVVHHLLASAPIPILIFVANLVHC